MTKATAIKSGVSAQATVLCSHPANVKNLAFTAFTEMLNNALDHSNGQQVVMGMQVQGEQYVYFKYFESGPVGNTEPGKTFHTTEIPARLAQLSSELVSRSQAKWVMNRATEFKTVILDFAGVAQVVQAFVDEVFRVFATAHPHIRLKTTGMSPQVTELVSLFRGH